jgi:hypothetical protein
MEEKRISLEIFVRKLKGRDHLEDRCRREDNIRMNLRVIGWEGMD